jgi:hypothetical protein
MADEGNSSKLEYGCCLRIPAISVYDHDAHLGVIGYNTQPFLALDQGAHVPP